MIFVTTGTQLPFPRLVAAMEAFARETDEAIVAQIGPDTAAYPHLDTHATLSPDQFEQFFTQARIIVAHAGIGTVLSAKRHGKPLILLPRRHALGEHRNDHQMATAQALSGRAGLAIAWDVSDLGPLLAAETLPPMTDAPGPELSALTGFISNWIDQR